jgi:hypothetical protein
MSKNIYIHIIDQFVPIFTQNIFCYPGKRFNLKRDNSYVQDPTYATGKQFEGACRQFSLVRDVVENLHTASRL